MGYYKILLERWQNISDAMAKIEDDNQSIYFSDFKTEVRNRVDEYKFLSEKETDKQIHTEKNVQVSNSAQIAQNVKVL